VTSTELPPGLEAIPLIFKNHCYRQGAEAMSNFIVRAGFEVWLTFSQ